MKAFELPEPTREKLREVIAHLESTHDDQWCMGRVRTADQKQNCLMGHVFAMGKDDKQGNSWLNWFEGIATSYMYFPVNDGKDARYPQATPRLRCIAYLKDILEGKEKSTYEMMEEDALRSFTDEHSSKGEGDNHASPDSTD
jgi:hypothetical protein